MEILNHLLMQFRITGVTSLDQVPPCTTPLWIAKTKKRYKENLEEKKSLA